LEANVLVITRGVGEKIYIGENITVAVVSIRDNQVKLAFEAPLSIRIDRTEVHQQILGEAGCEPDGNR
jgi:carbon storage regulator